MEDIMESRIIEALEEGDIDVLEVYHNSDMYLELLADILDRGDEIIINPSLIEYLISKEKYFTHGNLHTSTYILGINYIENKDITSYEKVLKLSNVDNKLLAYVIRQYDNRLSFPSSNDVLFIKQVLLLTVDIWQYKIKLSNISQIKISQHYRFAYCNCIAYIVYTILKDDADLYDFSISNPDALINIIRICYIGAIPHSSIELLFKHIDDNRRIMIIPYTLPNIQSNTFPSLFDEDI